MPKISEMRESKFLRQEDVGRGVLATITCCVQKNVAMEGADPEHKWCLMFAELDKPLVLNATNIQLAAIITGSDDTDEWIGYKVVLYTDPNVTYGGKLVGGIRIRKPKMSTPPPAAATKPSVKSSRPVPMEPSGPSDEMLSEDEIPFAFLLPFVVPAIGLMGLSILS